MRRSLFSLILLLVCLAASSDAQNGFNSFQISQFTAVGACGSTNPSCAIIKQNGSILYHIITFTPSGSPAACTVSVDSSPDGTTWTVGGIITGQTCTSSGMTAINTIPIGANFVRINVTALSASTSVLVNYTGWSSVGLGGISGATSQGFPLTVNAFGQAQVTQAWIDATTFNPSLPIGGAWGATTPLSNDFCGSIQAALAFASKTQLSGVIVDARGFIPPVACASNPYSNPADATGLILFGGGAIFGCPTGRASRNCNTSNPAAPYNTWGMNITLLLPGGLITSNGPWFFPQQSTTIGENAGGLITAIQPNASSTVYSNLPAANCDTTNTTGCWPLACMGAAFAAAAGNGVLTGVNSCENPGVTFGSLVNTPRIQITSIKFDCNALANCVGAVDVTAQEKSWIQNSQFAGYTKFGIVIACTGQQPGGCSPNTAQNAGPFTNLEFAYKDLNTNDCSGSTVITGILVSQGPSIIIGSGGHITFNSQSACNPPAVSKIAIDGGGPGLVIDNIHVERHVDAVRLGSAANCFGCTVRGITIVSNVTHAVNITAASVVGTVQGLYQNGPGVTGGALLVDSQITPAAYTLWPAAQCAVHCEFAGVYEMGLKNQFHLIAQTATQTGSIILAAAPAAGNYVINYDLLQSAVCAGAPTVQLQVNWTDAAAARQASSAVLTLAAAQSAASGSVQGSIPINVAAASTVTSTATVTGTISTCTYDLHIWVDRR